MQIEPVKHLDPARSIIVKFGGLSAVAKITGVTPHTVMRWRMPRSNGGTGGVVPHWHVHALLMAAEKGGIDLTPADFFAPSTDEAAA